jgi:phosphoglycerate kinase
MIIWSGPLGKIEIPELAHGSEDVALAIADSGAFSIIGGGDTIALLEKMNLMNKFSYVSTGGGAMLEFLAGKLLPGLETLNYNE